MNVNTVFLTMVAAGVVALITAGFFAKWIVNNDAGSERMREIASYIREGAMAFIAREYRVCVVVSLAMAALIAFAVNIMTAVTFIAGSSISLLCGYIGMRTATNANVRTAAAAQKGMPQALKIAFRGGSVMGLAVCGLSVLGLGVVMYLIGVDTPEQLETITGFTLGCTTMALFARVGGGIFTKAADVGADLVGKVEAGIPEDDPRNPAVIADNVGDNVGDVAGMGADLIDSFLGAIISSVLLAMTVKGPGGESMLVQGIMFPLTIVIIGVIVSNILVFFVGNKNTKNPATALSATTYIGNAIVLLAAFFLGKLFFGPSMQFHGFAFGVNVANPFGGIGAFGAVASGLVIGSAIGFITEVFTSSDYKPVKGLAKQAETGAATLIIDGLAVGLLSAIFPLILIALAIILAYFCAGIYGIGLAAVGMLATVALVVAVDAYGPVSDNAGGIAEMAGLPPEVREITDNLDAVGNTTAAIGKGFAIGAAALTVMGLYVSYSEIANLTSIDLLNPLVVAGLFIGGTIPFLFAALTMRSVGKTAAEMIEEVRRQFREDPGIMEGTSKPDYAKCVDISTGHALREMVLPGVVAIVVPIIIGLIDTAMLGGFLAGSMLVGVMLGLMMGNAGGAWDNAKKYIEEGYHGGKGSDAHKAAVVGDTVGDPLKDTSGPSMNTLITLMTVVALVFLPLFLR